MVKLPAIVMQCLVDSIYGSPGRFSWWPAIWAGDRYINPEKAPEEMTNMVRMLMEQYLEYRTPKEFLHDVRRGTPVFWKDPIVRWICPKGRIMVVTQRACPEIEMPTRHRILDLHLVPKCVEKTGVSLLNSATIHLRSDATDLGIVYYGNWTVRLREEVLMLARQYARENPSP